MKKYIFVFGFICSLCTQAIAIPLKAPKTSDDVMLFSYRLLLVVYNFNYQNYLPRQKEAATMFTGEGWDSFLTSLTKSRLIDSIKKNKYFVSVTPLSPPSIVDQGLKTGTYFWKVKQPAMVIYKNDTYQQVQYLNIDMTLVFENGIKARDFIATKGEPINCQKTSSFLTITPQKPETAKKK